MRGGRTTQGLGEQVRISILIRQGSADGIIRDTDLEAVMRGFSLKAVSKPLACYVGYTLLQ